MKRKNWSILIAGTHSSRNVRSFGIPKFLLLILILIGITGAGGLIRLTRFAVSFGYARFGVYQKRNEHEALLNKIQFLGKFVQTQVKKAEEIILFEDNTRMKFGMSAISKDIRMAGIGGKPGAEELILRSMMSPAVACADSIKEIVSTLLRQVELQNTAFSRVVEHTKRENDRWAQRPAIWPVRGRITSSYGKRIHPFTGYQMFHEGLDIANKVWSPICATADGIVTWVGRKPHYGNTVIIDHHRNGYETRYAHLAQATVVDGQLVKRGELIGYLGTSGRTTGPHVHYEVRKFGRTVDPIAYILPVDTVVD